MSEPKDNDPLAVTAAAAGTSVPASSRGPDVFRAGTVLAERYRIGKLLGTGGMGEVYEAEDLMLRERVAVKTVRGDVAKDATALARFKREIQLARRVTHASVCRIFDVALAGDVPFVTMELLDGETLASRLKRGRMAPAPALAVAQQMVAALAAAHEVDVVHRDFKSANVMLVDRGGSRGVRAVVTDFGLARALEGGGGDETLTQDGGIMGSPAYMAPEQVEGKRDITAAADIYALGVVLYEMVTGKLPFAGATPLETMTLRLREPPPPPRSIVPDLPPAWQETILRCLAREPARRFAHVGDVAAALADVRRARTGRRWLVVVAATALVVAAAGAWVVARSRKAVEAPATVAGAAGHPSVAILGFRNLGGRADADYLGPLLAEFLATDLSAGETLLTVDAESVARARRDLSLPDTESFARDTLKKIHGRLAADFVVVGSYLLESGKVHVDVKLQDTRSGATVAGLTESGGKEEMVALVGRIGGRVRAKLGAGALSAAQREGVVASLPRGVDVQKVYAEGVAQLRLEACGAARAPLEQAVAAEPGFPLAHEALSEALSCLGFDTRAEEEARKAVELSAGLPDEVRLAAAAQLQRLQKDWDTLLTTLQALVARRPDDLRHGVQLLGLQVGTGDIAAARSTLARLRKLSGGESAALDWYDAQIEATRSLIGEPPLSAAERLERFEHVRQKAEEQGARLVAAGAMRSQVWILLEIDDLDRALTTARSAKDILAASGDRDGILQALAVEVGIHQRRGDVEAVRRTRAQALAVAGELDSTRSFAQFERTLGAALTAGGDVAGSMAVYEELRAWSHDRGKFEEEAGTFVEIARLQLLTLDLDGADRSLAAARELKAKDGTLAFTEGARDLARGDVAAARASFERALESLPKVTPAAMRERARDLAALDLAAAEARWVDLEAVARRVVEQPTRLQGEGNAVADAMQDLVIALLEQGKLAEAKAEYARQSAAEKRAARNDILRRERLEVLEARLQAASGKPADVAAAERRIDESRARADSAGLVRLELQSALALGRIQLQAGRTAAGRATLEALARDARARGAGLLARNAETALAHRGKL